MVSSYVGIGNLICHPLFVPAVVAHGAEMIPERVSELMGDEEGAAFPKNLRGFPGGKSQKLGMKRQDLLGKSIQITGMDDSSLW